MTKPDEIPPVKVGLLRNVAKAIYAAQNNDDDWIFQSEEIQNEYLGMAIAAVAVVRRAYLEAGESEFQKGAAILERWMRPTSGDPTVA